MRRSRSADSGCRARGRPPGAPLVLTTNEPSSFVDGRHRPQLRVEAEHALGDAAHDARRWRPHRAPLPPRASRSRLPRRETSCVCRPARRWYRTRPHTQPRAPSIDSPRPPRPSRRPSSRSTSPESVQIARRAHPVLGQRARLVRADDRGRPECLNGAQPFHECAATGQRCHADGERKGDRRQQALPGRSRRSCRSRS